MPLPVDAVQGVQRFASRFQVSPPGHLLGGPLHPLLGDIQELREEVDHQRPDMRLMLERGLASAVLGNDPVVQFRHPGDIPADTFEVGQQFVPGTQR